MNSKYVRKCCTPLFVITASLYLICVVKDVLDQGNEEYVANIKRSVPKLHCKQLQLLKSFTPENLPKDFQIGNEMFFVETSGTDNLVPRESCALESAARFSNMHVNVIMKTSHIDLNYDNMCHLYFFSKNITFWTFEEENIFKDTPLQDFEKRKVWKESHHQIHHLSDLLRMAIIYKHGGFYSDLDSITMKDLSSVRNTIGQEDWYTPSGEFHFEQGHDVMKESMNLVSETYNGTSRIEVGPVLVTRAILNVYKAKTIKDVIKKVDKKDITIEKTEFFYPIDAGVAAKLFKAPEKGKTWSSIFDSAHMAHFYGHQTAFKRVRRDVKTEAYAYLGPKYCPVAYWLSEPF